MATLAELRKKYGATKAPTSAPAVVETTPTAEPVEATPAPKKLSLAELRAKHGAARKAAPASLTGEEVLQQYMTDEQRAKIERDRSSLKRAEEQYIGVETAGKVAEGQDFREAREEAREELMDEFGGARTAGYRYGDEPRLVTGAAMRAMTPDTPQNVEPERPMTTMEKIAAAVGPQVELADPSREEAERNRGAGIDWDVVRSGLGDDMSEEMKVGEMAGLKAGYNYLRRQNPDANPVDLLMQVYETRMALEDRKRGAGPQLKEEEFAKSGMVDAVVGRDSSDPLVAAFQLQRKYGQVPNLSRLEMAIEGARADVNREKLRQLAFNELLAQRPREIGYELPSGKFITKEEYDASPEVYPRVQYVNREIPVERLKEMAREQSLLMEPDAWYTDEQRRAAVLADPEAFRSSGAFEKTSVFGGTSETGPGWLMRSALLVPNAVAGAVVEHTGALQGQMIAGEELVMSDERAKKRGEDKPGFEDSPVLYNIAANLGFGGEAMQSAQILEENDLGSKYSRGALITTGFFMDALDPSFAAIGAAGKGLRTAKSAGTAQRAVARSLAGKSGAVSATPVQRLQRGIEDVIAGSREGLKAGTAEFMREAVPLGYGDRIVSKYGLEVGDPRLAAISTATVERQAATRLDDLIEQGASLKTVRETLRKEFPNSQMVKRVDDAASVQDMRNIEEIQGIKADRTRAVEALVDPVKKTEAMGVVTAVVRSNPEAAEAIKKMTAPRTQENIVAELIANGYERDLVDTFLLDELTVNVIEQTKDMKALEDYVMLTPTTFINKTDMPALQKFIKEETDAGKFATDLVDRNIPVEFRDTGRGVELVYDVGSDKDLMQRWKQMTAMSEDLGEQSAVRLEPFGGSTRFSPVEAPPRYIPTRLVRKALDLTADSAARGKRLSTGADRVSSALGAREVEALGTVRRQDLMTPMEQRFFGRSFWNDIKEKIWSPAGKADDGALSLAQQKRKKQAQAELSTIDNRLRRQMALSRSNDDVRAAYGIPDGKLTDVEVMGYLTLGGINSPKRKADLKETLRWLASQQVQVRKVQNVDVPLRMLSKFESVALNRLGQDKLRDLVEGTAAKILSEPRNYVKHVDDMMTEWENVYDASFLRPEYLEGHEILKAGRSKSGRMVSDENLAGAYYHAEADRIRRAAVEDMFGNDSRVIALNYRNAIPVASRGEIEKLLSGLGPDVDRTFGDLVVNRLAEKVLAGGNVAEKKSLGELMNQIVVQRFKGEEAARGFTEMVEIESGGQKRLVPARGKLFDEMVESERELFGYVDSRTGEYISADPAIEKLDRAIDNAVSLIEMNRKQALKNITTGLTSMEDEINRSVEHFYRLFEESAAAPAGRITEFARDAAKTDIVREGLGLQTAREVAEAGAYRAPADAVKAALGPEIMRELGELGRGGGFQRIEEEIQRQLIAARGGGAKAQTAVNFLRNIKSLFDDTFYTSILGLRNRFHFMNMLTAPFIVKSTTGMNTGLLGSSKARQTMQAGQRYNITGGVDYRDHAMTDAMGRTFTHGELYDRVVLGGGLRSAVGFEMSERLLNDTFDIVKPTKHNKLRQGIRELRSTASGLNDYIDSHSRLAVAHQALEQGRSIDDAVDLAQRAMFDYSDMTALERAIILKATVFYTFARQNLVNFMRNMMSPKGWQRIAFGLKSERGMEQIAEAIHGESMDDVFMPDYVSARPVVGIKKGERKRVAAMLPGLPANDAFTLIADTFSDPVKVASGFARPALDVGVTLATGESLSGRSRKRWKMDESHVAAMHMHPDLKDAMEVILGGKLRSRPGTPEEGAVDGLVYELTPEQQRRYQNLIAALSPTGVETLVSDVYRTLPGTEATGVDTPLEKAMFHTGIYTPGRMDYPEAVEAGSMRTLGKAISGAAKTVKKNTDVDID